MVNIILNSGKIFNRIIKRIERRKTKGKIICVKFSVSFPITMNTRTISIPIKFRRLIRIV